MEEKPDINEIKFLGKMYAQNAWGNTDAEKAIKWLEDRLCEEIDRNAQLEVERFFRRFD